MQRVWKLSLPFSQKGKENLDKLKISHLVPSENWGSEQSTTPQTGERWYTENHSWNQLTLQKILEPELAGIDNLLESVARLACEKHGSLYGSHIITGFSYRSTTGFLQWKSEEISPCFRYSERKISPSEQTQSTIYNKGLLSRETTCSEPSLT
jgi:hypothetical protein